MCGGFVYAKTTKNKKWTYQLNITLGADYYSRFLDTSYLEKDTFYQRQSWKYNAADNTIEYHFSDLSQGDYTFWSKDIFGHKHSVSFKLTNDTVVQLDRYMGYHPVPFISEEDLRAGTPVCILYRSNGCFHSFRQNVILSKEPDQETYRCTFYSNMEKVTYFNPGIGDEVFSDLAKLQVQSIAADTFPGISTTQSDLVILAGDKLFYRHDRSNDFEGRLCGAFFDKYLPGDTAVDVSCQNSAMTKIQFYPLSDKTKPAISRRPVS